MAARQGHGTLPARAKREPAKSPAAAGKCQWHKKRRARHRIVGIACCCYCADQILEHTLG